jgi:LysR family transcriptional regulator, mexEF-oprN operon transcriptional activator
LLPRLLRLLSERAPRLRVIAVPVQFRTVGEALALGRVDVAVTVADSLPSAVHRQILLESDLVCLFDRRQVKIGKQLSEAAYFAREHVIVSYNEDLRGVVEDALAKQRRVRCSVSSFANVPEIVEGSPLFGTVPRLIAMDAARRRASLDFRALPFALPSATTDLLWPAAADDDDACRFLRGLLVELGAEVSRALPKSLR